MNTLHNAYLECFHEKTYSKRTDQSQNMGWFNDDLKKMREHINFLKELKNQYNLNVSEQVKNCKKIKTI